MRKAYFISPLVLQKLIWIPTRIVLRAFGRISIRGLKDLDAVEGNAIFALNHSSEFDVFVLPGSLPFFSRHSPIFYTSREQKFYSGSGWRQRFYGGSFFKAWGAYPVAVGLNDYARSLEDHMRIVRDGGDLCIFPEGKITKDGSIGEAKGGIGYLAWATGRPVIPVYIRGTHRLDPKRLFSGRARLSIAFGAPMRIGSATEPSSEECKAYAASVMAAVRELSLRRDCAEDAFSPSYADGFGESIRKTE